MPDPLSLVELEPSNISAAVEAKSKGKVKPPSELDLKKEERLASKEQRLSTKSTVPSGPSVVPFDPSSLLDKIAAYKERFPHLKSRNKVSAKSAQEELEDEIHFIELQLGGKNDANLGCMIFIGAMTGLEKVSQYYNPLGLQLQGLGSVAKENIGQFQDTIDEIMIKYSANVSCPAEYRLAMSVGILVMTVHSANSGDGRLAETIKKMDRAAKIPPGSDKL